MGENSVNIGQNNNYTALINHDYSTAAIIELQRKKRSLANKRYRNNLSEERRTQIRIQNNRNNQRYYRTMNSNTRSWLPVAQVWDEENPCM